MTDQSAPANAPTGNGSAPSLRALSQFVKDLSFENPGNPLPEGQPNIDIGIDVSATPREDGQGVYESSLKLTARAHIGEVTLFLLELDYSGLFQVLGLGEQETEAALLIECPRMLFPFARRLVADVTREGGFPPLLIDPVDFVHLYRQQKQRQEQPAAQPQPNPMPAPSAAMPSMASPDTAQPSPTQVANAPSGPEVAAPQPAPSLNPSLAPQASPATAAPETAATPPPAAPEASPVAEPAGQAPPADGDNAATPAPPVAPSRPPDT